METEDKAADVRTYTREEKEERRALVKFAWKQLQRSTRRAVRIIYLDNELAEMTMFLLNSGVQPAMCEPVNKDREACKQIERLTKVKARKGDLITLLSKTKRRNQCVVWADLEQNSLSDEAIRVCLKFSSRFISDYTCRGLDVTHAQKERVEDIVRNGVLQSKTTSGRYSGRAANTNMVWVSAPGSIPP